MTTLDDAKKKVLLILACSVFQINLAQDLKQISFNTDQYKLRATQTVKVNDSTSLHIMVAKNLKTKKINFSPYYVTNLVKELRTFSFDKQPIFLSTHIYKNKWVIIYKTSTISKDIYSIAFDFISEKMSPPRLIFDTNNTYDNLITTQSRTFFISFSKFRLKVTTVYDNDKITVNNFSTKNKMDQDILRSLRNKIIFLDPVSYKFDYVDTDKYVEIGSTKPGHYFLESNVLILTYDSKKKAQSIFLRMDLNKSEKQYLVFKEFKNKLKKVKQIRSFYFEDKLFQFAISSQDASFQIFDVGTGLVLKTFNYTKSNFGPYNKYFFKSNEIAPNPSRFFNSFKRFRPYAMYYPSIFIVVNKSIDNGVVVEMGHVNGNVYNYNNFDMMWQMQQMQWQMQNNLNNFRPPSFGGGPNGIFNYEYVKNIDDNIKKTSFILSLDKNLNKTGKVTATIFKKDIWREKIDIFRYSENIQLLSYARIGTFLRCTYYDKTLNKLIIKEFDSHD